MAKVEDLIKNIPDAKLRDEIAREVAQLKAEKKFGLVFEEHIPELAQLPSLPPRVGDRVCKRGGKTSETFRVVAHVNSRKLRIAREPDGEEEDVPAKQVVVVKRFGEPIYPALVPVDRVTRAPGKPYHTIINADNYHALQLLLYTCEKQVDMIYIDPPYNTGARDWKYNNDYVDDADPWHHSKWLSLMEKRLRLAKKLLKPDGVLVVTIDEHEIHHLGCLLEQTFPNARSQMVTIVNNAAGVTQGGFYRVEEYAFFCFLGDAKPVPGNDDLLSDESKEDATPVWFSLIRYGGINALPSKRPGLVYPIAIDPKRNRIVAAGKTLKQRLEEKKVSGDLDHWKPKPNERLNGLQVIWPYRANGSLSTWQLSPEKLLSLAKEGFVRVRAQKNGPGGNPWSISYIKGGNQAKVRSGAIRVLSREPEDGALILAEASRNVIPKTVWKRLRHDAGKWGSRTIREVLGNVSFDYAKSPYAVLDTLAVVVGNRPNALILDFFTGSGTTFHATALLNATDGGNRRCILVTNNEVSEKLAKELNEQGYFPGDDKFEEHGICESVTFPRCKYVVNGKRDDGTELPGAYLNGREMKEGFEENLEYFKLDFLDPHHIAYGDKFEAIVPILWLMAGAHGERETARGYSKWFIPKHSPYAVLIEEDAFTEFKRELKRRPDITHVFLVTDSEDAYHEMIADLPGTPQTKMLYKSYLDNFKINMEKNLG
jgi:adenine-specific DNA-methyltransferase